MSQDTIAESIMELLPVQLANSQIEFLFVISVHKVIEFLRFIAIKDPLSRHEEIEGVRYLIVFVAEEL